MSELAGFFGGILSLLINISFEVARILIKHKKKLELKKEIWDLIKSDVEESDRLLNDILMDLSKAFGATLFFTEREYSDILNKIIRDVNAKIAKLEGHLERILANLKLHRDSVKEAIGEKDWLNVEPLINSLTPEGKINFEILLKTKYFDNLVKKASTKYGYQFVFKNFEELGAKVSRFFANTVFESLYANLASSLQNEEKKKRLEKCAKKFIECVKASL